MAMIFLSRSTSVHRIFEASPILAPVSFNSCNSGACRLLEAEISSSNSCPVGMKGILS